MEISKKVFGYVALAVVGFILRWAVHALPRAEGMVAISIIVFVVLPIVFLYFAYGRRVWYILRIKKAPARLAGEVWINNKLVYSGIRPYYWMGFLINRPDSGNSWYDNQNQEGPHFKIDVNPEIVTRMFERSGPQGLTVEFGNGLYGEIDDFSGAESVENGSRRRSILNLRLSLVGEDNGAKFEICGYSGFVIDDSVVFSKRKNLHELGIYDFKIWFIIPDAFQELVFENKEVLKKYAEFRNKYLHPVF